MRDLQEAIEAGCRTIEAYMEDRGEQMSFHVRETNMSRDVHQVPTVSGDSTEFHEGATKLDISITGVHLGSVPLKATLTKFEQVKSPDITADIPDAGYRAGVRALLDKLQKGIQNATEIAEGAEVPPHLRRLTTQSSTVRPDDNVAKLLNAVMDLADERNSAREFAATAEKRAKEILEADPEIQLQKRLKLKMKAQYIDQRGIMIDFVKELLPHTKKLKRHELGGPVTDELAELLVDEFLEDAGDDL